MTRQNWIHRHIRKSEQEQKHYLRKCYNPRRTTHLTRKWWKVWWKTWKHNFDKQIAKENDDD